MKKQKAEREMTPDDRQAINEIAYDPGSQCLDLSKAEKLRTTALMMAINYVRDTIVSDPQMYQALKADGKQLIPATTPHVIQSAIQFEAFLLGRYAKPAEEGEPKAVAGAVE